MNESTTRLEDLMNSPEVIYNNALALDRMGRAEEAEQQYRRALALAPDDPEIKNNLALLLTRRGRMLEAERCYEQAIVAHPTFENLRLGYGDVLHAQGRTPEAIDQYRSALSANPNCAKAHRRMAEHLMAHGAHEEGRHPLPGVLAPYACYAARGVDPSDSKTQRATSRNIFRTRATRFADRGGLRRRRRSTYRS